MKPRFMPMALAVGSTRRLGSRLQARLHRRFVPTNMSLVARNLEPAKETEMQRRSKALIFGSNSVRDLDLFGDDQNELGNRGVEGSRFKQLQVTQSTSWFTIRGTSYAPSRTKKATSPRSSPATMVRPSAEQAQHKKAASPVNVLRQAPLLILQTLRK